jgi:hypothetical protein
MVVVLHGKMVATVNNPNFEVEAASGKDAESGGLFLTQDPQLEGQSPRADTKKASKKKQETKFDARETT